MFLGSMMNGNINEILSLGEGAILSYISGDKSCMCLLQKFKHYRNLHVRSVHCCMFSSRTQ